VKIEVAGVCKHSLYTHNEKQIGGRVKSKKLYCAAIF